MKFHAHQPRRTSLLVQAVLAGLLLVSGWLAFVYVWTL